MAEIRTTSATGGQKGTKLARFDLIPAGPLRELAEHYGRGAAKYADDQWRQGYEWRKSLAALARHENDFAAGKDYDVCSNEPDNCVPWPDGEEHEPDTCFNHTGSHHMAAVAWHAFLLLEFKDTHPEFDDRYKGPAPSALSIDEIREALGLEPERGAVDWPTGPRGGDDRRPFRPAEGQPGHECDWDQEWVKCPDRRCRSKFHRDTA